MGRWRRLRTAIAGLVQDPYANPAPGSNIQPGDNIYTATLKNIPGNVSVGLAFGAALEVPANLATRSLKALLPNSSRRTRQVRAEQQVQEARQELVEAGIQQEKPDGSYEFTPETLTEDTTPNDIPGMLDDYEARRQEATTNVATAVMEPGGAVLPGSLPDRPCC